jgi:hypothetical protein
VATLTLDNDAQTEFDLTGVTEFDVISLPGSLDWTVRAIFSSTNMNLLTYGRWVKAHNAQKALTQFVLEGDQDVYEHPVTGSIVPV